MRPTTATTSQATNYAPASQRSDRAGHLYELRVTDPTQRELGRLTEGTAAAIVEFMLGALVDNPHRVGGRLQRGLAGFHSARRGAYRVIYEIDDDRHAIIVLRIDHRSRIYRSR